jgi:hypothetical protein
MLRRHAKIAFLVILPVVAVGFPPCNAQTIVSARASVTVTVVPGISAASPVALDFGRLSGETGNLELRPGATNATDLIISGPPSRTVWITFPSKTTLRNAEGDLLSFTPEIGWKALNTCSASGSAALDSREASAFLSSDEPLFIKFGGSINPDCATGGSYRGHH